MEQIKADHVEELIFTVKDRQVMLDYHLAEVLQVQTKRLNEHVKHNKARCLLPFMFQLRQEESYALQLQIVAGLNIV